MQIQRALRLENMLISPETFHMLTYLRTKAVAVSLRGRGLYQIVAAQSDPVARAAEVWVGNSADRDFTFSTVIETIEALDSQVRASFTGVFPVDFIHTNTVHGACGQRGPARTERLIRMRANMKNRQ